MRGRILSPASSGRWQGRDKRRKRGNVIKEGRRENGKGGVKERRKNGNWIKEERRE